MPVSRQAAGDPLDDGREHVRIELARGDVVEEEQGPRSLHEDVVDAVVHEIRRRRCRARPVSKAILSFVPTPSVDATSTGSR